MFTRAGVGAGARAPTRAREPLRSPPLARGRGQRRQLLRAPPLASARPGFGPALRPTGARRHGLAPIRPIPSMRAPAMAIRASGMAGSDHAALLGLVAGPEAGGTVGECHAA